MTITNHTLFEEYLRGTLLGEEKQKLELILREDSKQKEEFDVYKLMRRTLSPSVTNPTKEKQLQEQLERFRKKYARAFTEEEESDIHMKRPFFGRRIMSIAASAAFLLFALTGVFKYAQSNYSPAVLAANNFNAPKYVSGDKSAVENFTAEETKYVEALEAYRAKNYTSATTLSEPLMNSNTRSIREDAQWLIVMTELSQDDIPTSKALLTKIADNPQHNYSANAQKLLSKLDSPWFKLGNLF